jgi:hypothetical protein
LTQPVAESPNLIFHAAQALALAVLIVLYAVGTWSRSYILPAADTMPLKSQIIASVPVGFVTMGLYAKSAFPALSLTSQSLVFDCSVMMGYAMILGMLSRETLARILHGAQNQRP